MSASGRPLNFVVGGGPTGVEMAARSRSLQRSHSRDFRNLDPRLARVILVEAGPRILPSLDERLLEKARRSLEARCASVRL